MAKSYEFRIWVGLVLELLKPNQIDDRIMESIFQAFVDDRITCSLVV